MKGAGTDQSITICLKQVILHGELCIPENSLGLVVFSHLSGSSRLIPRNNSVARKLQEQGLATLLFDLLTEEEYTVCNNRFNIELLTERIIEVTQWIKTHNQISDLYVGFFGATTLMAADVLRIDIIAKVSRGGRPDLAMNVLEKGISPTLLLVGGDDTIVIELYKKAYKKFKCERSLNIIPDASHLFHEKGTFESGAISAAKWFKEKIYVNTIDYV